MIITTGADYKKLMKSIYMIHCVKCGLERLHLHHRITNFYKSTKQAQAAKKSSIMWMLYTNPHCNELLHSPSCTSKSTKPSRLHSVYIQTSSYQACASKWIARLLVSTIVDWECSKPCIKKRILWAQHHMWLLLGLWISGLLVRAEWIGLILSHRCHLSWWRCSYIVWKCKWIWCFEWVGGWCSIYWLLGSSICSFVVQATQSERIQSASLAFNRLNS